MTVEVEVTGALGAAFGGGLARPTLPAKPGENGLFNFNGGKVESAESNDKVVGLKSRPGNILLGLGPSDWRNGEGPFDAAPAAFGVGLFCGTFLKTSL